ncbi:copper resistance CopC family protein [Spiribacter onubensis]|uniref:Copper resistance CopC family protein n=1 Tax=Spiribacter onubensis TaxID=3122420 RepID=A0ABV3S789_9GAMM
MRTLAALFITVAVAWGPVALAHSEQRATVPADGAQLKAPPPVIEIGFDGEMRIISVTLTSAAGEAYDIEPRSGRSATDTLTVDPPELPAGDYILEWRGLATDGHAMSGELKFSVMDH